MINLEFFFTQLRQCLGRRSNQYNRWKQEIVWGPIKRKLLRRDTDLHVLPLSEQRERVSQCVYKDTAWRRVRGAAVVHYRWCDYVNISVLKSRCITVIQVPVTPAWRLTHKHIFCVLRSVYERETAAILGFFSTFSNISLLSPHTPSSSSSLCFLSYRRNVHHDKAVQRMRCGWTLILAHSLSHRKEKLPGNPSKWQNKQIKASLPSHTDVCLYVFETLTVRPNHISGQTKRHSFLSINQHLIKVYRWMWKIKIREDWKLTERLVYLPSSSGPRRVPCSHRFQLSLFP